MIGLLSILVVAFFPDVVFGGRTLTTSSFQWGVMGDRPPYGYPEEGEIPPLKLLDGGPEYNNYLADPLATSAGIEPRAEEFSRRLRQFHLPSWSSNMGMGSPLLASWVFHPQRIPVFLAPSPGTWDAFLLLRLVVVGILTYVLAGRLGVGKVGAFAAASAFAFSGYLMLFINMPHVDFAMMIPAALLAFDVLVTAPSLGRVLLAGSVLSLGFVSDNPRTAVVLLLFVIGYAGFRAVVLGRAEGRSDARHRLVAAGMSIVVSVGLTLWVLLPFLELTGGPFFRGEAGGSGRTWGLGHVSGRRLLTQVMPFLEGAPAFGFDGSNTGVDNYVGLAPILVGTVAVWGRRAMRPMGWFFLAAALLAWAKIYGFPLVNWLGGLPVLSDVRWGKYLPPVAAFSVAMLAGMGTDALARGRWRTKEVLGALGIILLGLTALLVANRKVLPDLPRFHLALQFALLMVVIAGVVIAWLVARSRFAAARIAPLGLIVVILGELLFHTLPVKESFLPTPVRAAFERSQLQVIDRPVRHDPYTEPPFVEFLERDRGVFRAFGLDRLVYPNTSWAYDLDDIRAFTPTMNRRLTLYVKAFINPTLRSRFTGALWPISNSETEPPLVSGNRMFDLLNVKYVMSREPGSALLDDEQFTLVHEDDGVRVYENRHVIPRAFLVHDVVAAADPEDAIEIMRRPGFDPTTTAVVEDTDWADFLADGDAPDPGARVTILSYADTAVEIEVSTRRWGLLVLSDSFYPGWSATVDGRETEVLPTDALFRSVPLPPGRHRVEFKYRSKVVALGGLLSMAVIVVLLAGVGVNRLKRRSPPTADEEGSVS